MLRERGRLVVVTGQARPDPDSAPDVVPIVARLNPIRDGRLRSHDADSVEAWASAAGMKLLTRTERREQFEQSPLEAAHAIEQRAYSYLWGIDDRTWSDVVVPIVNELRALPDPERPRTFRQRQDMLVFEK